MGKNKVDFKGLEKLQKQLEKMETEKTQKFLQDITKELAARLLAKVIKRTPVGKPTERVEKGVDGKRIKLKKGDNKGKYKKVTAKTGGELRRGWTAGKENMSEKGNVIGVKGANGYLSNLDIIKQGDTYIVTITNPVDYASYVEYGHRTRNHKGWVKGNFMLTISEQELNEEAPRIIEKKLLKFMEDVFKC